MAQIYNHATMGDTQKNRNTIMQIFMVLRKTLLSVIAHLSIFDKTSQNCSLTHYLSDVWEESIGGRMSELLEQPYTLSGVGVCGKEPADKL